MKWINRLFGSKEPASKGSSPVGNLPTNPETAKEFYKFGYQHHQENRLEEAVQAYRQAVQLDPNFALVRSNLGMVYKLQGKLEDAIREWQETLDRGGANTVVRMNTEDWLRDARASLAENAKPIAEVEASLKSYLDELGRASSGWHIASQALARLGAPAVGALIQAVESENDLLRSRSIDLLGRIGDKRALPVLEKAARMNEQDFRKMTGLEGRSRSVSMGGTQIEVSVTSLLDEYHHFAREALKKIGR
jgi:tetratricopeptide (TPR) repeat protein